MAHETPSEEIVCLARANTLPEAYIWRQALEDEGITCKVVGDYVGTFAAEAPGYPEVWVHSKDVERAKAILEPHWQKQAQENE